MKIRHIAGAIMAGAACLAAIFPSLAQGQKKNVLNLKTEITDSNIIFPESYEADTQKMLEGWYMKNYTATDDRYRKLGDVHTDDATMRDRLAKLPTIIDLPFNSIVRSYIERYTSRGRDQVAALLGLSLYYMPIFEQALEENGLPLELKYLPVIESALDPNAVSKHGAAGLWQFMLASGKGLGLEVSSLVDERRDPYLSSKTAAKFLKDLYDSYGDWSLAIAAYNCGPGTVNKAIRRAGGDPKDHDFWSIYYYLPSETRGYVPMFIAANYVMNYYKDHNISPVLPTKPLVTDTIMVSDRVHLEQISHVLDIPMEELKVLNPQFRANIIPGSKEKAYTLILPSQQCHAYIMSEEDIRDYEADKYLRRVSAEPGQQPSQALAQEIDAEGNELAETVDEDVAPVNPNEELNEAAQLRGQSNGVRQSGNGEYAEARRRTRNLNQTTPTANTWASQQPATRSNRAATASNTTSKKGKNGRKAKAEPAQPTNHTVKSGENLTVIAKKYGVSVNDLKKANNIQGDALQPGDKISLPGKGKASSSKTKAKRGKKGKKGSAASKKSTSKKSTGKKSKKRR